MDKDKRTGATDFLPSRAVSARFERSASRPDHYPDAALPEIAFIGRSNVGKSSMINKLVNRKRLVKTSGKPGCTRLINFFIVNEGLRFVDLPGYGYAAVPDAERMRWKRMIETYLEKRSVLRGVVLIVDIRRDPDEKDLQMNAWLMDRNISAVLALTKADKLSQARRARQAARIAAAFDRNLDATVVFSAKTGLGLNRLWQCIDSLTATGERAGATQGHIPESVLVEVAGDIT